MTYIPSVFGGISQLPANALSITGTPVKFEFDADLPSRGIQPDSANNEILVLKDGVYELSLFMNAALGQSVIMTLTVYVNGSPTPSDAFFEIIQQADGANFGATTFVNLDAGDTVSLFIAGSPNRTVTFQNVNFVVRRL